MREKWARYIALLTGLLVILLAVVFALTQNPAEDLEYSDSSKQASSTEQFKTITLDAKQIDAKRLDAKQLDAKQIEAGNQVYQQQSCALCHAIAGKGNPRNPLDGVGERRNAEELRNWITGGDLLQGKLPDYAFNMKQAYKELPEDELDALIIYMQSLQR